MRIPLTYIVFRSVTLAITLILLVLAGLGLSSHGPFSGLGWLTGHVVLLVHRTTGVKLP
jgi:hypothetical protein